MQIWCKDGSFRALKSTRMAKDDNTSRVIHTGKNMTSSWQILAREEMGGFTIEKITFGSLPDGVEAKAYIQGYITYNDGTPYPDLLLPFEKTEVVPNCTQGVIIVLKTSEAAAAGEYTIGYTLTINGEDKAFEAKLNIHDVTVPLPENATFDHEYFFNFHVKGNGKDEYQYRMNPYYADADTFSDKWWDIMKNFAQTMKTLRVNSLWTNALSLLCAGGSKRIDSDNWSFDFTRFDQFVQFFLDNGSFKYITLVATVKNVFGEYISIIDENGKAVETKIFEEDADKWAKAYLCAIRQHFIEKGWIDKLLMHIEDEPHQSEYWNWFRAKIKEYIPEIECLEPIDSEKIGGEIADGCDIFVPRLEVFEREKAFYQDRVSSGKNKLWCYSCCYPEEPWYLNKFIDLPQSYSRLIKWACFANHIDGFLHWGFNFWTGADILYGMHPNARFKGDGFIVYPDVANNSLILSNRGLATIEGIEDCEILNQLKAKNESQAYGIANSVAKSFIDFNTAEGAAENARAKVLQLL